MVHKLIKIMVMAAAVSWLLALGLVFLAYHNYYQVGLPATVNQPTTEALNPPVPEIKTETLIAVGDIMLSRHVGTKMFESNDYALPFSKTLDLLSGADLRFGNLESPFYNRGGRIASGMIFKAEPQAIAGLKSANFNVLSLANNHTLNQGSAGLLYTLDYLKSNNILPVGAGADFVAAHQGAVREVNGVRFGFLAYSYAPANDAPDGQNVVAGLNLDYLKNDIAELKNNADIIIISLHAGNEYTVKPSLTQQAFARAAIDNGADLVIGHHPHWAQTVEKYKEKWIFYSLGNFVFDQEWSRGTKEGLMLKATWQGSELQELKLLPVIIENYSTPRLGSDEESRSILDKIGLDNPVVFSKQN